MSLCASVSLPPAEFRLATVLGAQPGVRVEAERVVPLDSQVMPYLWITGLDAEDGIERLRADPDVVAAELLAASDDGLLVSVDWAADHPLLAALANGDASLLRGVGTADGWRLSLRFPNRDRLADCYRECSAAGVSLTVEQIHTAAWSVEGSHGNVLTDVQRETLLAALDGGYFAVPRTTTLQDLAREFDVSDTAISQRIRRGVARLLSAELAEDDRRNPPPVSPE
ncbi:bacterio-opsin activator [Halolamina pelagica]|uniref:Bacterio-opsin activator n=1 Tax=Halolamina pelagica TaxID=699431 RepID=A0A0P7GUJ4_9EURY|nr:helix-turn-helix domain-containing protein [Halolamina pelagica]KPN29153.1 bacterio-opsin activator [Halolamina pelagica]